MPDIMKLIEDAKGAYAGKLFLELPEEWMDDAHYWCKNGHRSTTILRCSEGFRDRCLACREPVRLGPKELPGVVPK